MASQYTPTIGLEVHAELKTRTKMFCNSKNDPNERTPNVNVCPICMGHPGTLPVINKEAVKHVLKVGIALNSQLADFTEFDRKNYFYPDLPKGYQISQYEFPLVSGGELNGIEITRIHLEEDTARSTHTNEEGSSLVDFNRGGIPLMELVTEPVIKNAKQAGDFARELQLLLRTLNVSNANMEKGEMRVEANVSVSKTKDFGTKVEVKNINSFKAVERAIEHEITRQIAVLEQGDEVVQETRGWDEDRQETFSQRIKEESADYRYFPDPDLPKLKISEIKEFAKEALHAEMPQLPWEQREEYVSTFKLKPAHADVYVADVELGKLFKSVSAEFAGDKDESAKIQLASNYIINNLITLRDVLEHHVAQHISPASFAKVVDAAYAGDISSNNAVDIISGLAQQPQNGDDVDALIAGNKQQSDTGELTVIVEQIIADNASVAQEYKDGKEASLRFLVGQGMKLTGGKANPQVLSKLLQETLQN